MHWLKRRPPASRAPTPRDEAGRANHRQDRENPDIERPDGIPEEMPVRGGSAEHAALASGGLPEELAEFLTRDTYSLLIKGNSGTGKTILALSILKAIAPIENVLYISTRTSPLQLLENYPWIEEVFGPGVQVKNQGKESEGWENLVDARLDEPNIVFERITNVLMDKQAPTVVIDSWESLSDALGTEALRTNIKVLQSWRERAGARFIFVGEDPENSAIDFMVEGVVLLKDRIEEGKRLRELVLSKLHGVQISRPSHFFTLEGGVFRSLPAYSPRDYAFRNPLPVTFDQPFRRTRGRFPTGYDALDRLLDGGYPSNSSATIELGERIDPRVGLVFLSRIVHDWLSARDSVLLVPPLEVEPRFLAQYSKSFGSAKRKDLGELRVFSGPGDRREKLADVGVRLRVGKGGRRRKLLLIDCASRGIQPSHGRSEAALDGWADLAIAMGRKGSIREAHAESAAVRLKLIDVEGTLFLESELPWSSLFGIVTGTTGGNPMIQLAPVV